MKLEPMLAIKGKENKKGQGVSVVNIDKTNTREKIAKEAKISTGNIHKVKKILEKAPEEIKAKVRDGDISINHGTYADISLGTYAEITSYR